MPVWERMELSFGPSYGRFISNHSWAAHGAIDIHFYFHFDALNAGYLAGGFFRTRQFPSHRKLMRSFAHLLQCRHGLSRLHWWHVKAHAGNPWNECADAIAKFASLHPDRVPGSELWHEWLHDPEKLRAAQWIGYLEQMQAECLHVPRFKDGFLECDITQVPLPNAPLQPSPVSTETESTAIDIDITIATANVLTLNQSEMPQKGTSISRQSVLMQQFHDAKCLFVGVQETRHRHLVGLNNPWYHVLGHPASAQGQDGVQLWISHCHPIHHQGPCIKKEHIRIVHASPTLLIAKVNLTIWKCVIITGRAPHSGRPRHEAQAYWNEISMLLKRKALGWPIFFCGDANAHVGECPTSAIGNQAPAQENQAGEVFHHWLLDHDLKLPASFAESHPGPVHNTFHSPDEMHSTRIDYIALPQEIQYNTLRSWVAEDIDLSVHRTDHHAVLCHCTFQIYTNLPSRKWSSPKWDSHHLSQQLQTEEVFYTLHSAISPAPWQVDPHTMATNLAMQVDNALYQITRHRKYWKRKSHITDATWQLVDHKKLLFKQLRQMKRTQRHTALHACFHAWRATTTTCTSSTSLICQALERDLPGWSKLHDHAVASTQWQYTQKAQQVREAVQAEDTKYYQHLADQTAATHSVEGLTGIWKHIRALLPKNRNKRNAMQHDLGPGLLKHFQELEAGETFDLPQLQLRCVQRNNKEINNKPNVQYLALEELPTLTEIEEHCLKQRPHKAPGPDGVPSSLCRSGAAALAPQLHAMICKSFMMGIEPFRHKGGHLCTLFKHKGSRDDAAAYRGILLADSFAKVTHAWTRQKLLPIMLEHKTIGQLGGLPSQQTLTGIQILKLHGSVSKAARLSTCTLFLDLKAAFHHLLRELVFLTSDGMTPEELAQTLDSQDFDIQAIVAKIEALHSEARAAIPPGLRQFLHDIHHQTWFQLRDDHEQAHDQRTQTRRGSRPGSPLADIAFNMMMSGLLQDLQAFLMSNDQFIAGCEVLGITIPPIAWMDDVAIPLTTTTPEALVPLVQQVLAAVHGFFRVRGLTLNLERGKTEAVLCFRGPGADRQRLDIFDTGCQPVIVVDTDSHILSLRVVPSYKHLGAQFTMNIDVSKEIGARISSARQAFEEMKKPLFLNKRLPVAARMQLFQSLILSRLLYGCAVWSDVPAVMVKKLETTLTAYYRQIHDVGFWKYDHITDDAFRREHQLPTFRQIWARHKLIFLQHVAQRGTVFHKALLFRELETTSGWLTEMHDDLTWLSSFIELPFDLPHDRQSWVAVWEFLRQCRPWKSWVRKACCKHLVQEKLAWEVGTYHDHILDEMRTAGLQLLSDSPQEPISMPYRCHHCTAEFPTHQQRALHEFRVHDELAAERYYVQSTVCGGCLKDFHTTYRVTQHLRYRPNRCWDRLYPVKAPADPVTIQLPDHLQGVHRLPAVRRHHGPLRPTSHHRERQRVRLALQQNHDEGEPDYAWWEPDLASDLVQSSFRQFAACLQQWTHHPTEADFHNEFFNLFLHMGIPEFQAARIFIAWIETDFQDLHTAMEPEVYEILDSCHMTMLEDIHTWQLRARRKFLLQCWERLEQGEPDPARQRQQPSEPRRRCHAIPSTYCQLQNDEAERQRWVVLQHPRVEMKLADGPYYIVHLYSGRRRDGDFQHYMQEFLTEGPAELLQSVLVISIDTAIHEQMNVHDKVLWNFLLSAARQGQILAVLMGPPCETWSSARFEEQTDEQGQPVKGPRPLRVMPDSCWGLKLLTFRELLQVSVGNSLLLKGLQLCACVAVHGGAVALEHPAPPYQADRPSIWRTAIIKLLSGPQMPFRQYTFQQWRHGAAGVKPTTLLYANAAIPQTFAANEQADLKKPTTPLIGRLADGSYRTSFAKEYPSGMNRSFAESFWRRIHHRFLVHGSPSFPIGFPQIALNLATASACVDHGRDMMPDYQPV